MQDKHVRPVCLFSCNVILVLVETRIGEQVNCWLIVSTENQLISVTILSTMGKRGRTNFAGVSSEGGLTVKESCCTLIPMAFSKLSSHQRIILF